MKKWFIEHPYFSTSFVFFVILIIGWQLLYWNEENLMFLLLLYFIVTLGIRLDDISKKLDGNAENSAGNPEDILGQLKAINTGLLSLNTTLSRLADKADITTEKIVDIVRKGRER